MKKDSAPGTLFDRLNARLAARSDRFFWYLFALAALFGLLLFDVRFSVSGDDTAYVVRAYEFSRHNTFPGFQGPLYPIVLAPVVAIAGLNPVPLKLVSLLFLLGSLYLFYRALKDRVPALILFPVLFLTAVNSYYLYYGSQTYSEALFMLAQAAFLYVFFRFFAIPAGTFPFREMARRHLFLALSLFGMGLTRSIGFSAAVAAGLWFMAGKRWKDLLFLSVAMTGLFVLYQGLRMAYGPGSSFLPGDVLQGLLAKDYYKPALGSETMAGFAARFLENSNYYLSGPLWSLWGLRGEPASVAAIPLLAVATSLIFLVSLVAVNRKNPYILFTGIYAVLTLAIIFLVAHTIWKQSRFLAPYLPLLYLLPVSALYYSLEGRKRKDLQFLLPVVVLMFLSTSLLDTARAAVVARKVTGRFSGLTPDWEHYCRMSQWIGNNLPPEALVACRKPSISFVYSGGRTFFGIIREPFSPPDSLAFQWKRKGLHYYMVEAANLNKAPVTEEFATAFRQSIVGFGVTTSGNFIQAKYFVLDLQGPGGSATIRELEKFGVPVTDQVDSLEVWSKVPGEDISMVYPDSLLNVLSKAHVSYILTDNIRSIAGRKNTQIRGTAEFFMNFIEAKYPGIRTRVMQVGDDNDEPAILYKLNYPETR